ncbi:lamina-associated polypeptide 2, isoforms beta/delta/epsilon/gamma-like isoform X2 [Salmo trutta]|uniref:lamina-associated polypeptide 2, isoforms beta/delta/epsilon/gamma-like isoform X2 n=1 Tax=Salmo trutta TaxID=8032 RepID=UPI0011306EE3|nr:lamina-associated polypeptide 2, isoforms beta/delta/epsilon/gamma-like isoform X2 [Salmo trutta]
MLMIRWYGTLGIIKKEQVTDVLMEMFPETEPTRTGIAATRQRPIKGAAGRPVQFKYPDLPASPMTLQRQALERRLVPLFVQILVFLILTCLFYLIYAAMEHSSDHPFVALLDNLSMGTETEGLSLQADPLNSSVHPL